MRILMANHDMEYLGGTQVWARIVREELLRRGHEVDMHVHRGQLPRGWAAFQPDRLYDLALINHHPAFRDLRAAQVGYRILTSHGVLPDEERVVPGADAYVAVSEAARTRIPFKSSVIHNPIDSERFSPTSTPSPSLRRVAFVSNRQGRALSIIEEACSDMGLDLRVIGRESAVADPERIYNWADLVIGIARTAMEALACGRNVLAFDYFGYHGMVTKENFSGMQVHNFGGHAPGSWPSAKQVRSSFELYDPERNLRPRIVDDYSPSKIVDQYLEIAGARRASRVARLLRRAPRQLTSPRAADIYAKVKRMR